VIYESSYGSANYLNLDNLVIGGDPPEGIRITSISFPSPGQALLAWDTISGRSYRVQFCAAAANGTWTNLGAPILATNSTTSADYSLSGTKGFWRIVEP
jgi:hypothetical protein